MEIKTRHHLRADAVDAIRSGLAEQLGISMPEGAYERVVFEAADWDLVLVEGEPTVVYIDDEPFVTVRGANAYDPTQRLVTVDTGAVAFVSDGADVMRPGIVEADPAIEAGDLIVIVEEQHGKALAVGRSRVDGADLPGEEGKVVDSIHHVGDDLYAFTP